ncbi:WD40-repeat-containing domain protein [Scenedesmus sp. NREL 46B-D3]|nr:WD40-repeat-containing domain protein [Scenedesmus sp. NREL 46B-D3]
MAHTETHMIEVPQCLFTLSAFPGSSSSSGNMRANKHQLQVTSVSWSKTGQTLAASFGRYDVEGWCCIPGAIATWNLARIGHSTGSAPDRLISADSCVMACAFHPTEPALLAGGTYNGELVVWDLNREDADAQIGKTDLLSDVRHREPITGISWQLSEAEARRHGSGAASYRLFTLGADGRLLVWLWGQLDNPIYGYELQWMSPGAETRLLLGGSCLAFCPAATAHEEASLVVVGTEGGRLLLCQVNDMNEASVRDFAARLEAAAAAAPGSSSKVELRSAVKDREYAAASATVNALSACPHHRQLALAAGGDGSLRVLDTLRSSPLLLLEPSAAGLLSAGWSPSRPLVFAAGSADGNVYLYDLASRQRLIRPVAQLQVASSSGSQAQGSRSRAKSSDGGLLGVNALAYNTVSPSTLAAAAGDQVKVWQLPASLVDCRPGEAKLLQRLLDSEDVLGLLRKQALVA